MHLVLLCSFFPDKYLATPCSVGGSCDDDDVDFTRMRVRVLMLMLRTADAGAGEAGAA